MTTDQDPAGPDGNPADGPTAGPGDTHAPPAGGTAAASPLPVRRRSWLRIGMVSVVLVLSALVAAGGLLLGTERGLHVSLTLVERLAPGLLVVEEAKGRLLGDLELRGLALALPGLSARIDRLELRWRPAQALTGTLRIAALRASDVEVAVAAAEGAPVEDETARPAGPIELPDLASPLDLVLEELLVERLRIATAGGQPPLHIDRIAAAGRWSGSALTLTELAVALPEPALSAAAAGKAELRGDYPLEIALDWHLTLDPTRDPSQGPGPRLAGRAALAGDLAHLRIEHELSGAARVGLTAEVRQVLADPRWEGKLRLRGIDLPTFLADLPAADLQGELTTAGDLREARVQGRLVGRLEEGPPADPGGAARLPDLGRLAADLDITWSGQVLRVLDLALTLDESGTRFTAGGWLDLSGPDPVFEVGSAWQDLRWPLTGEAVAEATEGRIDAAGSLDAFSYRIAAAVQGRDFPAASLSLTGSGDTGSTRIEALRIDTLDGTIEASGEATFAPALGWDLTLTADGLDPGIQWPGLGGAVGLTFASRGDLDDFSLDLTADAKPEALPAAALEVAGRGQGTGIEIASLRLGTLGGTVQGKARLDWAPTLAWDATLDLADLDPGRHWPEWSGTLGGRITSAGSLGPDGPALVASIDSFRGRLRGYPLAADGRMRVSGTTIAVEELRLASGPSDLRVAGSIGEALDLELGIGSPDLASLLPAAQGRLKASGTLTGTRDAPALKLGLDAAAVAVAGQRIGGLRGSLAADLAPGGPMNIDLRGQDLVLGSLAFERLRLAGDGDMGAHRLSAELVGQPLSLDLEAAGGLEDGKAYRGRLEAFALRSQDFGSWALQKTAPVTVAPAEEGAGQGYRVDAGPVCLREKGGSGGCLGFAQKGPGVLSASLDIDRLAFALVEDLVPKDLILEGEARAKADFLARMGAGGRDGGASLTGKATLEVPAGRLGMVSKTGEERLELLDFGSAGFTVETDAKGLRARLATPLVLLGDRRGDLTAVVGLPGWRLDAPLRPDQALEGGLEAEIAKLGEVVSRLVPQVRNLTGNLEADVRLRGRLAQPLVGGFVRLADAGFQVPLIGLAVEDLELRANGEGDRLDYTGGLTAGAGRLDVGGSTRLTPDGPLTRIEARGTGLTLADSPEYFVLADADLTAEVTPAKAHVAGTILVPEARIRPRTIPAGSVTLPSSDVTIASAADQGQPGFATSLDVRLKLGDKVAVSSFGLEGFIDGELAVLQAPGQPILGSGELRIRDGTYRISTGGDLSAAIGRPLTIRQGFLNYAKSPIDNPFLVLTAQREGGDVTAGLRVFGTIRDPKMTFFSATDPGMTQSEVTTYLLTGIPPKRDAEPTDRGLSLGTYITPDLFAEYESNLGDEADKLKLRYRLTDRIELQTETGDSQGGDIFFTIER